MASREPHCKVLPRADLEGAVNPCHQVNARRPEQGRARKQGNEVAARHAVVDEVVVHQGGQEDAGGATVQGGCTVTDLHMTGWLASH